jgi:hypothetical protein
MINQLAEINNDTNRDGYESYNNNRAERKDKK